MTITALAPDVSVHPLEPVRAAVRDMSRGAPLLTLGTDAQAGSETAWHPGSATVRRRTCCLWFTSEAGRGDYCSTCCVVR